LTVPEAEAVLADAGLKLGEVKPIPSKTPKGLVVGQGPKPGMRVVVNDEMRVYASTGPAK
jgi:beta-lactam-binding protein with PASTA domain